MKTFFLTLALLGLITGCSDREKAIGQHSYSEQWKKFETKLIKQEKSFQEYEEFEPKRGDIQTVTFETDSFKLKGLLNTINIDTLIKKPVIVYFHGGFALSYKEMEVTKPFTDAGYIVFAPTYRGENGNPGYFELFMGEVRDAKAAINWISSQKYTDNDNIYIFGWSVGGGISLNLSLHSDIPVKLGGSSAGVYDYDLIKSWATEDDMIVFPYDYTNKEENYFRLPIYNLKNMVRSHLTYVGEDDGFDFVEALKDSLYPQNNTKINLIKVEGNHVSSLNTAMEKFLIEIERTRKTGDNKK
jgi:acetyl esterase/lipase